MMLFLFIVLLVELGTVDLGDGDGATFWERYLARSAFAALFGLAEFFGSWAEVVVIALAILALVAEWLSRPAVRKVLVSLTFVLADVMLSIAEWLVGWLFGEHPVLRTFGGFLVGTAIGLMEAIWCWVRGEHPWLKQARIALLRLLQAVWTFVSMAILLTVMAAIGLTVLAIVAVGLAVVVAWAWVIKAAEAAPIWWEKVRPVAVQIGYLILIPVAGLGIVLASPVLMPAVGLYLLVRGGEKYLPLATEWAIALIQRWGKAAQVAIVDWLEHWRETVQVATTDWFIHRREAMRAATTNWPKRRREAAYKKSFIRLVRWAGVAVIACFVFWAIALIGSRQTRTFGLGTEVVAQTVATEKPRNDREESFYIALKAEAEALRWEQRRGEEPRQKFRNRKSELDPLAMVDRWVNEKRNDGHNARKRRKTRKR